MKPVMKVGAFLLAVMMLFTAVFAAGCTPASFNKEWAYKTSDNELAIGVYIYSLCNAYNQAKSFAEKLDDYDSSKSDWLDKEITDDDGKKQVAREWIKNKAKELCLIYLLVDAQVKAEGIDVSGATLDSANEQATTQWNVGPYADYGYIMPDKDNYEPYGVSFESYAYCTSQFNTKYQLLFEKLYNEGGSKYVNDDELTKYFTENYTDYVYLPVNLYSSTADEAGTSKDVAMSDAEIKKITKEFDQYAKDVNKGKSIDDVISEYMSKNSIEDDPSTSNVEPLDKSSIGDELKEAICKLKTNEATTLKVGSGNTAIYYLVFKGDIKKDVKNYINNASSRPGVLANMKSDEYKEYVEGLAKKLEVEENASVINQYKPELFFVPVEPTTAAEEEETTTKE